MYEGNYDKQNTYNLCTYVKQINLTSDFSFSDKTNPSNRIPQYFISHLFLITNLRSAVSILFLLQSKTSTEPVYTFLNCWLKWCQTQSHQNDVQDGLCIINHRSDSILYLELFQVEFTSPKGLYQILVYTCIHFLYKSQKCYYFQMGFDSVIKI